ncbi:hypothetical protein SDC9_111849 [bioreactor metagenome]|uniref:Ribosome-associated protein quality control protein P2 RNA-binding domain-containing protein n=1 Tax=bioreactor metagenome TaxID=1076179 RepID=A0A645BHV5_9ZZZZ|nr:YlmH/Sll1252 family protein [Oscillospiraceae bacterium]
MSGFSSDIPDDVLVSRVHDKLRTAERGRKSFLPFLDGRQSEVVKTAVKSAGFDAHGGCFVSYGGYPDAERLAFGFISPESGEDAGCIPIKWLCIDGNGFNEFSHRDVLGAVLSLGIRREFIGDILLISPGKAYVAVFDEQDTIAEHIASSLERIGRGGVTTKTENKGFVPSFTRTFERIRGTCASPRFDAIISEICNIPRSEAKQLIESELAVLNYSAARPDRILMPNDIFSVRGYGKFIFISTDGTNKRDRIRFICDKYI